MKGSRKTASPSSSACHRRTWPASTPAAGPSWEPARTIEKVSNSRELRVGEGLYHGGSGDGRPRGREAGEAADTRVRWRRRESIGEEMNTAGI
jgi:hypothetical protein